MKDGDAIDVGLPLAELYLKWLADDDRDFSVHVVARREAGEVRLYFGDGEKFRIHAWDGLDDATAERVLADWIGRQIAALDISAHDVGGIGARPVE